MSAGMKALADAAPSVEQALRREWGEPGIAARYLAAKGFILRSDLSYGPPHHPKRRLLPVERRAVEYLLLEGRTLGLLTDAQHSQRRKNLAEGE